MRFTSSTRWTRLAVGALAVAIVAGGCARGASNASLRPEAGLNKSNGSWGDRNPGGYGLGNGVERSPLSRGGEGSGSSSNDSRDTVYFQSDSAELTPEGRATLSAQLSLLRNNPTRRLTIEGHADERGTREYNIALGARRAESVRSFLASSGMNPALVRTVSYGKERPVATCDDISCWSKNRRAQVVLSQ